MTPAQRVADLDRVQHSAQPRGLAPPEAAGAAFSSKLWPNEQGVLRVPCLEGGATKPVFTGTNVDIPQGSMICVCGPRGIGKNTFLQLLGQVLVPDEGVIFVPPHLRVLYVPSEVYFIKEDIVANIFFGSKELQWKVDDEESGSGSGKWKGKCESLRRGKWKWKPESGSASVKGLTDSEWRRALRICERLGFPDRLMKYLSWDRTAGVSQQEEQRQLMSNNAFAFTRSDRALLQIARALICNPEVLVIQNPTLPLDRELRKLCWKALRAFVDERGIEMPIESRHKRRPRTCICSTSNIEGLNIADKLLLCADQTLHFARFADVQHLFPSGEDNIEAAKRIEEKARQSMAEEKAKQSMGL